MKKILSFAAALLSVCAFSAGAAEFTATNQYKEGQFGDVSSSSWYAKDVKSAYELGFMKGTGENLFSPNGDVKLSEAVTTASRIHAIYNNKKAPENASSGAWYTTYVAYAEENGIIEKGEYTDFTKSASRHEVAEIIAAALPKDYYKAINNVTKIPDVPSTNAYADELLMLYNAGVVMGNDEYGTFKPESNIKRSEMSAIINRAALPESRLTKTLTNADYEDAYYLLDDAKGFKTGTTTIYNSSWNYDNRDRVLNVSNVPTGYDDRSDKFPITMWRDIDDQDKGIVTLESNFSVKASEGNQNGFYFAITDDDKKELMRFELVNGEYQFNGKNTGFKYAGTQYGLRVEMDLDTNKATLFIEGKSYGEYDLPEVKAGRVYVGTTEAATGIGFNVTKIIVYRNYLVNEKFDVSVSSEKNIPADWTTNGFSIVKIGADNYNDAHSVYSNLKAAGTSTAVKKFNKISGNVVFESYVLLPKDNSKATVTLKGGDKVIASMIIDGKKITTADGKELRHHTANIWQTLRIEADTTSGNVTYKINGKDCGTYYTAGTPNFADSIEITHSSSEASTMYFDDVEVYLTHEYDDYCPTPVPVTSDKYDAVLNMCSLWHEGQHNGWSAVSAFADKEPVLGYYDEGLAEAADWEIKYMVEHGIEVQHLCWFAPADKLTAPIKKSKFNDALHDGYFNAKYSDMMKFTFMWENSTKGATNLEEFQKYIWNYWIDYYFTDDRFYVVDNKPVFTVWSYINFMQSFGGTSGAKKAKQFMDEDIKKYGFDGVIMLFADAGANQANVFNNMANYGGDGAYAYHWQQDGANAESAIKRLEKNVGFNKIHIVPTASVGFNNIGWDETRKPMASLEDHKKQLEYIRDVYLPKQDQNSWKSQMLIISTWNEYGEGTYVMPSGVHGFGYLDNVRNVLIGDNADMTQYNVVPTEQQKARLVHMYTGDKTSLVHCDNVATKSDNPIVLNVDSVVYDPSDAIVLDGGEYYVPAEPMKGFFSLHNFYYEWSRFTGRLYILTKDNMSIEFNVGSDKVLVNGKEQKLAKAFELCDGLPMMPYKWLMTTIGNNTFKADGNKLSVSVIDPKYQAVLATRVANEWEFNIPGDIEGWVPTDMRYEVTKNGTLLGTATPKVSDGKYDCTLSMNNLNLPTKHYYKIKVRAKFDIQGQTSFDVFFKLNTDKSYSATQRVFHKVNASDEFQEFELDLSGNENWTGTLTGIRIDPIGYTGTFEIDYIKLLYDEKGLDVSPSHNTTAFEIYNGDASDTNSKAFFSTTATIDIIDEPGNTSNKVFNVLPLSVSPYTYIRHRVTYTPGATYEVSFKAKLIKCNSPSVTNTTIRVVPVYADPGSDKANSHIISAEPISIADGWKTIKCTFKVPADSSIRSFDQFSIYAQPEGDQYAWNYYIDDVVVTEKK